MQFLSALQSSLQFLGYNTHRINTHSFRIGAATYYANSFELVQANSSTLSKAEKARAKADMNMTASYRDEHTCINAVGNCFIIWTVIGSRMSVQMNLRK
jgi:hypothetical protein